MKIAFVGHGRIEIPPVGYGAVESVINDYSIVLRNLGHEVLIANEADINKCRTAIEVFKPDVLHVHDEHKSRLLDGSLCDINILTTHDPTFFKKPNAYIRKFALGLFSIGCLSPYQQQAFHELGVHPERTFLMPNGANPAEILFSGKPTYPEKAVCLATKCKRKRQHLLSKIRSIELIGPPDNEWSRVEVCSYLTDFGALVLISSAEAAALVIPEALMAGLSLVISNACTANLDLSKPFITVLSENDCTNPFILNVKLQSALKNAPMYRVAARKYAEETFDWNKLVKEYVNQLWHLSKQIKAISSQAIRSQESNESEVI